MLIHPRQCTATSKRSHRRCRRIATPGWTVCYYHGSRTPIGPGNGQFKHGRYSRYLPARMLEQYQQVQADPDLLTLSREIALLDVRLVDLLQRMETGESGALWKSLQTAMVAFQTAQRREDPDGMKVALTEVLQLIQRGSEDQTVWAEIRELIQERRALVESDWRRLIAFHQVLTVEQALVLLASVEDTIRKHVTDRNILRAISTELNHLVAVEPRQPSLA